jgi:hypothetical protein
VSGPELIEWLERECNFRKIPPTDTAMIILLRELLDIEVWVNSLRHRRESHAQKIRGEKELQQRRVKQYEDRIPCGNCGHVHLGCCSICNNCSQIVPPVIPSPVRAPINPSSPHASYLKSPAMSRDVRVVVPSIPRGMPKLNLNMSALPAGRLAMIAVSPAIGLDATTARPSDDRPDGTPVLA